MKIAQFIDTLNTGGAETMLARLSIELSKLGHDVTIYHFGNPYLEKVCAEHSINHFIIPFSRLYKSILTVYWFSLRFSRLLKKHKVQILHSHLYGSITGTFPGTFLFRVPHIGTLHDLYMVQERTGRGMLLRLAQLLGVNLVAVSKNMQNFYQNYLPFSGDIEMIYNGFNFSDTDNLTINPAIEKLDNNSVKLICVARLIKLKRHAWLIRTLEKPLKDHDIQLILVGDGDENANLSELINSLELQDKVLLLGERNDVQALLHNSDIFILASESEGLSCSIIEAMSAGLPCIATNVGGNPELVQHEKTGYIFEVDDQSGLTNSVLELYKNRERRIKMGIAGKKKNENEFNINGMTRKYSDLYSTIIK